MTNLEKIRAMPAEELAEMLSVIIRCERINCNVCPLRRAQRCRKLSIKNWLESEVEE